MLETLIRHLDMVRLTLSAVAVATLLVGCVGFISDPSDDGLTVNQRKARDLFVGKAYTVAMEQCGGCHVTLANSDFLKGNAPLEVYQTIKEFKPGMINFIDAAKSRLLTKGVHSGPEFALATRNGQTESDYEVMLAWLRAEQRAGGDAVGGDGPSYIVTAKFTPTVCMGARAACQVNTVSLRGIRPDKTGIEADVEFLYEVLPLSNSPYLANLKVKAGAEGAYVESPVFLGYTAGNTTPTIDGDAFFAIKTNVAANMSATIGGGFAGLTDLRALSDTGAPNEMAISFQVIDKYKPEGGAVDPSVCKAVASPVSAPVTETAPEVNVDSKRTVNPDVVSGDSLAPTSAAKPAADSDGPDDDAKTDREVATVDEVRPIAGSARPLAPIDSGAATFGAAFIHRAAPPRSRFLVVAVLVALLLFFLYMTAC